MTLRFRNLWKLITKQNGRTREKADRCHFLEIYLDKEVFEALQSRAAADGVALNRALAGALTRGMEHSLPQSMWQYKEDYETLKKVVEVYRHDNDLLKALVRQNWHFQELLDKPGAGGDAGR